MWQKILIKILIDAILEATKEKNKDLALFARSYKNKLKWKHPESTGREEYVSYKYSIIDPGQSEDVLWFHHGFMTDHNALWKKGLFDTSYPDFKKLFQLWIIQGNCPKIATISYGNGWFLNDRLPWRARNDDYTISTHRQVMKEIEARHDLSDSRMGMGISMGGLNLMNLLARDSSLFKRAAVINPMVPLCDPWDILDFSCLSAPLVRGGYNKEDWDDHDPNGGLKRLYSPEMTPVQVSYALQDEWNLTQGGLFLGRNLSQINPLSESHPTAGKHGNFDPLKVLRFLSSDSL